MRKSSYLKIAGRYPRILSREEERAAWEAGDYNLLVESVWPLVVGMAHRQCHPNNAVFDELISSAAYAIAVAIKTFDPDKSRFISYACRFLQARLYKSKNNYLVRCADETLDGEGEDPTVESPPESSLEAQEMMSLMRQICSPEEQYIIERHLQGDTFKKIGESLGISRQAVNAKYHASLDSIRDNFVLRSGGLWSRTEMPIATKAPVKKRKRTETEPRNALAS